jgi:PAP2 superfamily
VAAGAAWVLAHVAKAIADRPRPYEVMTDAVLRQQPAHGTSYPSSHTAVTVAVVIALVPFLARPLAAVAIAYAVLVGWSRVYLGVHYPLDVLAGAGIGIAVGGVALLALRTLLHRAGRAANGYHPGAPASAPIPPPGTGAGRPQCHRSHPPNRFRHHRQAGGVCLAKRGDLPHASSASAIINSAWPSTTHLVITMIKVNPTVWPTLAEVASPRVV